MYDTRVTMLKPDILKLDLLSQFPSKIAVHQADERLWCHPLLPEEELLIKSAQPRRKEEFRAGRHSARAAIQSLGGSNQPILIGAHRQPLWPEGYTGSISHTQTACLAACAKTDHYHAIGIDLEQNEALGQDIIDLIHTSFWMAISVVTRTHRKTEGRMQVDGTRGARNGASCDANSTVLHWAALSRSCFKKAKDLASIAFVGSSMINIFGYALKAAAK